MSLLPVAGERDVARDLDFALLCDAVREAGAVALDFFKNGAKSWEKKYDDPVSEADIAVDELLKQRLMAARPDYGWMSEESADDKGRLTRRKVWVVDPIDGTRAFLKGKAEFTICAALVDNGAAVAGAVFNPATDEFYDAIEGGGARLNARPIKASGRRELSGARLIASKRTFEQHHWIDLTPGAQFAYMNSIAYRMAKIASGDFDAAVSLSEKSDWDIAAAELIVREAGGCCTTRTGEAFVYNLPDRRHPSVLASGAELHDTLVALLGRS